MNRQSLWHVPLLTGLVVGVGLGLIYTWLISPVQYYRHHPGQAAPRSQRRVYTAHRRVPGGR